jgi:formylglycine-generating enzyme required for sulfatase activity
MLEAAPRHERAVLVAHRRSSPVRSSLRCDQGYGRSSSRYRPFAEALLTDGAPGAASCTPAAPARTAGGGERRTRGETPARLRIGGAFRDHEDAPELVIVPAGRFWMGANRDEPGRHENELPRHRVRSQEKLEPTACSQPAIATIASQGSVLPEIRATTS